MAVQLPLELDAPEQSTKVGNSGCTTVRGRGFVFRVNLSQNNVAEVGGSLNVGIDFAFSNFIP